MSSINLKTATKFWRESGGEYDQVNERAIIDVPGIQRFVTAIVGLALLDSSDGEALAKMLDRLRAAESERDALKRQREGAKSVADYFRMERDALANRLAEIEGQEPVAYLPYISDCADGVKGHYAIGRHNPKGYSEFWNLRSHRWASCSDDVLTYDQAVDLLSKIEIPTAAIPQSIPDGYEVHIDSDGSVHVLCHDAKAAVEVEDPTLIRYFTDLLSASPTPDQCPKAVLLPEKKVHDGEDSGSADAYKSGWNSCIDKVSELNASQCPSHERGQEIPEPDVWHSLKTDPCAFDAVAAGTKTYEIRFNDRLFAVGDGLLLRKTTCTGDEIAAGSPLEFTGDELSCVVTHVLSGYGLTDGWVILSIKNISAPTADKGQQAKQSI